MGLNVSFFKTPKHRVFKYRPIYYNEQKEQIQERVNKFEKEKAASEGKEWRNEKYHPGLNIRGCIRSSSEDNKRHSMNSSMRKYVTLISIVLVFVMAYFTADYIGVLFESVFNN